MPLNAIKKNQTVPVLVSQDACAYVPDTIRQQIEDCKPLYLVEEMAGGKAFISTDANPVGHLCTVIKAEHITARL